MKRTDIINLIIKEGKYNSYLEIGIRDPDDNFNKINVPYKIGVDPAAKKPFPGYTCKSDEFFRINKQKFDLIFVDGDHSYKGCKFDIDESLKILNPGGTIVVHDINPLSRRYQSDQKNGKCWIVIAEMRMNKPDLWIGSIFDDFGCSIIKKGLGKLYPKTELTWEYFVKNKPELMNEISANELRELYK